MAQVIWTEQAFDDLQRIHKYMALDSVRYAQLLSDKLFNRTQTLITMPELGRVVPELANSTVRELIEGNYRIIYEIITEEVVLIQTVWHSARPLPPDLLP